MGLPGSFEELQANGGVMVYLPRLHWRADYSLAKLREAGFQNIERVEGVDAAVVDVRAEAERRGWYFEPSVADGEIGCSLSMLALWERIVEEHLPYLLVFEDDVLPHNEIARVGPEYWSDTPTDAEFVLLGSHMATSAITALPDPDSRVVQVPSSCTHAYVVTEEGARRALERLREFSARDRWISTIDMELLRWMVDREIRYVCWNATMLPPTLPWADEVGHAPELLSDAPRGETGLVLQNYALGSAIWPEREPPLPPTVRRDRRPHAVLISPSLPSQNTNRAAIRVGVVLEALAWQYDVDLIVAPVYGRTAVDQWVTGLAPRVLVLGDDVADPFLRRLPRITPVEDRHRARIMYPRSVHTAFSTPEAAAEIMEFVGGETDLLFIAGLHLAPLAEPWLSPGPTRPRFVLDVGEDDAETDREMAALLRGAGDALAGDVFDTDAAKADRLADEWLAKADVVLVASSHDVDHLEARDPMITAAVLATAVPPAGSEGEAEPANLLFVGDFSYPPNIDAARWLCLDVLPLMRSRMGDRVRVAIAGSSVDPSVSALAEHPDVTVVADPPSASPWYRSSTVAVAPLRAGGGTRLEVLEAFAHQCPVVSTSAGAQGLRVTDGVHLFVADSAEAFADACVRLLRDPALRAALADAAVEIAINHSRPRVIKELARLCNFSPA